MGNIKKLFMKEEGFTLIEMAIVLFVISILLLLIIPNISKHQEGAAKTGDQAIVKVVETQKELYRINEKEEPTIANLLSEGYLTQEQVDRYNEAD